MPLFIQYDKATGAIAATVYGTFTPEVKASIEQVVFDKPVDILNKLVDTAVVVKGKTYQAGKDEALILKDDPNAPPPDDGVADPIDDAISVG